VRGSPHPSHQVGAQPQPSPVVPSSSLLFPAILLHPYHSNSCLVIILFCLQRVQNTQDLLFFTSNKTRQQRIDTGRVCSIQSQPRVRFGHRGHDHYHRQLATLGRSLTGSRSCQSFRHSRIYAHVKAHERHRPGGPGGESAAGRVRGQRPAGVPNSRASFYVRSKGSIYFSSGS